MQSCNIIKKGSHLGCDPLGYGMPGTLSGWQSRYSGIFVHGNPNNLNHETTQRLNPNHPDGNKIYTTYDEFYSKCASVHAEGTATTPWERGQYTAYQIRQKIDIWNSIFGAYGTISSQGGAIGGNVPANIRNASASEKVNFLFPNGVPSTTVANAGNIIKDNYLTDVTVTIVDGSVKQQKTIRIHKALAQDIIDIFKELETSGFPIHSVGGNPPHTTAGFQWRDAWGSSTSLLTPLNRPSNHAFGTAIDINPAENGPGDGTSKYKITKGSPVYNAFVSRGWRWGGPFNPEDPMHFDFGQPNSSR